MGDRYPNAEEPTPAEMVEPNEESDPEANLALLVAALGGGPGDRFDSEARCGTIGPTEKRRTG